MDSITAQPQDRAASTHERINPEPPKREAASADFQVIDPRCNLIRSTCETLESAQRLANRLMKIYPGTGEWYVRQDGKVVHVGDPSGDTRSEQEVCAEKRAGEPKPELWRGKLPAEHITKGTRPLRKSRARRGRAPLFFEGPTRKDGSLNDLRLWGLPATGGYIGGRAVGEAAAMAYFKSLSDDSDSQYPRPALSSIAESMMCRFEDLNGRSNNERSGSTSRTAEFDAFQGQYLAFFWVLEGWLQQLAALPGARDLVAKFSWEEILAQAQRGLAFDEPAYMAACQTRLEAELAEEAAEKKRAKGGAA